jgi:hypothetical protein
LLLGIILTLVSTIRVEILSIPDAEEIRYGLPFFWLFHQTISIVGPVDIWSVQWLNFALNFIFWIIISVIIVFMANKYKK